VDQRNVTKSNTPLSPIPLRDVIQLRLQTLYPPSERIIAHPSRAHPVTTIYYAPSINVDDVRRSVRFAANLSARADHSLDVANATGVSFPKSKTFEELQ
jgi:hypothetical protein